MIIREPDDVFSPAGGFQQHLLPAFRRDRKRNRLASFHEIRLPYGRLVITERLTLLEETCHLLGVALLGGGGLQRTGALGLNTMQYVGHQRQTIGHITQQ